MSEHLAFVDPHMHLWDLGHDWYSSLWEEPERDPVTGRWLGIGDWRPLRRHVTVTDYRAALAGAEITLMGCVHVTAAKKNWLDETRWLTAIATQHGLPTGIVTYVDPNLRRTSAIRALHAHLAASPLVRGVRFLHGYDLDSPTVAALMAELAAQGLVFDLVHDAADMPIGIALADRFPDLTVVLEHAGWPKSVDPAYFARWQGLITALAARDNTHCKISGLGMTTRNNEAGTLRPWVEHCLESFGTDRCMVATNFPVDSLYGSVDTLLNTYAALVKNFSVAERTALFNGTASRVYNLTPQR